jgi:hypothetical protein
MHLDGAARRKDATEKRASSYGQRRVPVSETQVEYTSVGTAPLIQPQAECLAEETGDPETIMVASLSKKRKQKGPAISLPPRTNLRPTPARQARALKIGSQ